MEWKDSTGNESKETKPMTKGKEEEDKEKEGRALTGKERFGRAHTLR